MTTPMQINELALLPDLFKAHPETRAVFNRLGLRVVAVLHWRPELEPVFVEHGFDLIRNPVLRRTVARQVSLAQVCRMKGVDLEAFLAALNDRRSQVNDDPSKTGRTGGDVSTVDHVAEVTVAGQPMGPSRLNATVKA